MRACGVKIATKGASKNYLFIKTLAKVTFGYLAVVLITLFFAIYARSLFFACWKASWKVFRQSFLMNYPAYPVERVRTRSFANG